MDILLCRHRPTYYIYQYLPADNLSKPLRFQSDITVIFLTSSRCIRFCPVLGLWSPDAKTHCKNNAEQKSIPFQTVPPVLSNHLHCFQQQYRLFKRSNLWEYHCMRRESARCYLNHQYLMMRWAMACVSHSLLHQYQTPQIMMTVSCTCLMKVIEAKLHYSPVEFPPQ